MTTKEKEEEEEPPPLPSSSLSLFCAIGSESTVLSDDDIKTQIYKFLDTLGPRYDDVVILPPDFTRFHSHAGEITQFVAEYYNFIPSSAAGMSTSTSTSTTSTTKLSSSSTSPTIAIMPALGTHVPMTDEQIEVMFGHELASKRPDAFRIHDWRNDVVTIGYVPASLVRRATHGMVVNQPWPAQLNKFVWERRRSNTNATRRKSLILSIGQVVPHEVTGMANYNKNLFVGVGGVQAINLSHYIGAIHGMEQMMGRSENPLRDILNYASTHYLEKELDLWYILTVMGTDAETNDVVVRGLYIGNTVECYERACELSLKVNFTMLDRPPKKMVVFLDKDEFHSTWLGNKAIYRTRLAIADDGELIIVAPGVCKFGEDEQVDALIRKYGYVGTHKIMKAMKENDELKQNLSAVAHLIHGSTEGRFHVTWCPGKLTKGEIESVGFNYGNVDVMMKRYAGLKDGWHTEETDDGGSNTTSDFYFISNPALGLWAVESRFNDDPSNSNAAADESKGSSRGRTMIATTTTSTSDAAESLLSTEQIPAKDSAGVGGWVKSPPS